MRCCHFSLNHFSEWHVITLVWFSDTFYVMIAQSWPFCFCWYQFSTMPVAKRLLEHNTKHKKTQNTQQPTWAATTLPSSGFAIFCHGNIRHGLKLKSRHSSLLWVRCRRPAAGLLSRLLVPLFEVLTHTSSKNRAMGMALALGGCHFMIQHHNQPNSWRSGKRDARVEARGVGSALGDAIPSFGQSNQSTEKKPKVIYTLALDGCWSKFYMQQLTKNM